LLPLNDGYYHPFEMSKVFLGDSNSLSIVDPGGVVHACAIKKQFMPYEMTASKACSAQIVFAGYGITAPEYNYDDYAGIDVDGKIVFVLKRGPRQADPDSPFLLKSDHPYLKNEEKINNAIEHGAVGIMMVTDPLHNRLLTPKGFPWPSLYKGFPPDAVPLTLAKTEHKKIPAVQVGERVIKLLFGSVDSLKKIQTGIDSTMQPHSFPLSSYSALMQTSTRRELLTANNIVGFLPGSDDKLKEDIIVVGAHYDHIGYQKNAPADQDSIYNGADDNASGTVGVMQLTKAFMAEKKKPKRSILFMTFAGEEKGLFGSYAYVDYPLFPLQKTIAMFNFDMIGRNHPDTLFIRGSETSSMLKKIVEEENKKIGFTLITGDEKRYRGTSDYRPFMKKGIPVLYLHTDTHEDLHKVTDSADKIDFEKMNRVVKLAYRMIWNLANSDKRPVFEGKK
ncbi:M28 family peptidase, partial [candidate division KSB1 bacterium]|nr:M28 family peptidase [candidate division KSB1 bacterium]